MAKKVVLAGACRTAKMCFDVFGADKIEQFNIQMGEELTVSFDVHLFSQCRLTIHFLN